jgi:hypothetical protein
MLSLLLLLGSIMTPVLGLSCIDRYGPGLNVGDCKTHESYNPDDYCYANTLNVITLRCGSVQRVTMATESSATVVVGMIWLDTQQLTMLCINFTIVSSSVFSKK